MIKLNKEVVFQVEWLAKQFSLGDPVYEIVDGETVATVTLLGHTGILWTPPSRPRRGFLAAPCPVQGRQRRALISRRKATQRWRP